MDGNRMLSRVTGSQIMRAYGGEKEWYMDAKSAGEKAYSTSGYQCVTTDPGSARRSCRRYISACYGGNFPVRQVNVIDQLVTSATETLTAIQNNSRKKTTK